MLALTRSPARAALASEIPGVEWRHCDLFSASAVEAALEGVDYAVYLVHSLAPSSRLTQARPRDLDLVLADNFARAAAANGVRQVLFVGGPIQRPCLDLQRAGYALEGLQLHRQLAEGAVDQILRGVVEPFEIGDALGQCRLRAKPRFGECVGQPGTGSPELTLSRPKARYLAMQFGAFTATIPAGSVQGSDRGIDA